MFPRNSIFMPTTPPVAETLRRLITDRRLKLKPLAKRAGVDYQALRRWFVGTSEKLDVTLAEKVYKHLTGKGFSDE